MNRAIVIRTVGNPEIAGAIVDGMTQRVIPLDTGELAEIKAEYARLKARDDIRNYGDSIRWNSVRQAMALKYQVEPLGRFHSAILAGWGLLWDSVYGWYKYFCAWNRGEM